MAGRYEERNSLSVHFAEKPGASETLNRWSWVYICDECIELCSEIIEEEFDELPENSEFPSS